MKNNTWTEELTDDIGICTKCKEHCSIISLKRNGEEYDQISDCCRKAVYAE